MDCNIEEEFRAAADYIHPVGPAAHCFAVDCKNLIASEQAPSFGAPASDNAAYTSWYFRLDNPKICYRIGFGLAPHPAQQRNTHLPGRAGACRVDSQIKLAGLAQPSQHLERDVLPNDRLFAIYRQNFIAFPQPRCESRRVFDHTLYYWGYAADAVTNVNNPIHEDGQQEVCNGACRDNCHALPERLVGKGKMTLTYRYIARLSRISIFLAQHFHVATKWDRRNDVFHSIPAYPGFDGLAEANREAQHFDATASSNPKMTKLVNRDEYAQGDEQCDYANQKI